MICRSVMSPVGAPDGSKAVVRTLEYQLSCEFSAREPQIQLKIYQAISLFFSNGTPKSKNPAMLNAEPS